MRFTFLFLLVSLYALVTSASRHSRDLETLSIEEEVWKDTDYVVSFEVVITEGMHNPDGGQERMVYFVNGKFASEELVVDEGNIVEIHVVSRISDPFTIHGHGIEQTNTPWMDGVPGITQKMIQPGSNFTYRWKMEQYGFYHLHAHSKSMQDDGLFFGLYSRPSLERARPFAQISSNPLEIEELVSAEQSPWSLVITDWRHYSSKDLKVLWRASNIEPLCAQSMLINGVGTTVCPEQDELDSLAAERGFGNVTALGCLSLDSPFTNPPIKGFGLDANESLVPENLWKTCSISNTDTELYTVRVDNSLTSWAVLNMANTGGLWTQQVSIDQHPMYIFAVDGEYVNVSSPVDAVSLISGMRISVAIKLAGEAGSEYIIRVAANDLPQMISGYAVLQYAVPTGDIPARTRSAVGYPPLPTSTPSISYSGALLTTASGLDHNATQFVPAGPDAAPFIVNPPPCSSLVTHTIFFNMSRPNGTTWAMNSSGLPQEVFEAERRPLIWESEWTEVMRGIKDGKGRYAETPLVTAKSISLVEQKGSIVDLIFLVPNQSSPPHPIHKHFNKFWVIGEGFGNFTWSSVAEAAAAIPESFNFVNAPLRDGYPTPPALSELGGSWLAVRYVAENPGPMLVHCHISQHGLGGMLGFILQAMEDMDLPDVYREPIYPDDHLLPPS